MTKQVEKISILVIKKKHKLIARHPFLNLKKYYTEKLIPDILSHITICYEVLKLNRSGLCLCLYVKLGFTTVM